jgi:hypothetical protein
MINTFLIASDVLAQVPYNIQKQIGSVYSTAMKVMQTGGSVRSKAQCTLDANPEELHTVI